MDLTPKQKARIPEFVEKWEKIGLCTDPADRPRAEAAIREIYRMSGYDPPGEIVWCQNFLMEEAKAAGLKWTTADFVYGQHEAYWLCYYDFLSEVMGDKQYDEKLKGLMELAKSAGWILACDTVCFVSERHNYVELDTNHQLHSDIGPAISWTGGWEAFLVHGVEVPAQVVVAPVFLKPTDVLSTTNQEVRRVMLERYGFDKSVSLEQWIRDRSGWKKFMLDVGPEKVHEDDFGVLMKFEIDGEPEPIMMVKVVNGTPEKDGTYKDYMLQVPPTMTTAREAVAWTYEKDGPAYAPTIRT